MKREKFLIIGSTGFIGSHLVHDLVNKGYEVISFSRSSKSPDINVTHIQGDLQDKRIRIKLLRTKPDVIVCLAGFSGQVRTDEDPQQSFAVNTTAYINLLDELIASNPKVKVIFSSSRLEYGKPVYLPVDESHPIRPLSVYGLHKYLVSTYCQFLYQKYNLPTVVLRTSNPFGPYKSPRLVGYNIINHFIQQARKDDILPIFGSGKQKRDYIFIDDFIEVIMIVAKSTRSNGEIYNVGSGRGVSLYDAAQIIIKVVGKGKIKKYPWPQVYKKVETGDYITNISHITKQTKWQPKYTFEKGIEQILKRGYI